MPARTVREAVGVFQSEVALQSAADELLIAGFDRADLSLLADARTVEQTLGHAYKRIAEIEDDPTVPKRAYAGSDSRTEAEGAIVSGLMYVGAVGAVGAVVASGGTVAAALIGAAVIGGAGGLIGTILARFIEHRHAHGLQSHLDRGGLLLWVRTSDVAHESRACEILMRAGAQDVHLHCLNSPATEQEVSAFPDSGTPWAGTTSPANELCAERVSRPTDASQVGR
jgi:hypothetical protein